MTVVTRESVLNLMKAKDAIEVEIEELMTVLSGNGIGISEPLVDREGYPRQDVDVYQVRHARHRIICLQNDHKRMMKQIEDGLHKLHATQGSSTDMDVREEDQTPPLVDPIALINEVTPGSPAAEAGLQVSDQILEFGTVNSKNFKSLKDIALVAQHSIARPISVRIQRSGRAVSVSLTPRHWGGRGLLGCNIVPTETVDR